MKIRKIEAKNFKSMEKLSINDFGDINTFIGKNSSGKSNILQLIRFFFHIIVNHNENTKISLPDHLWYLRRIERPISISLSLELTNEEESLLNFEGGSTEKETKKSYLKISIEIKKDSGWKLIELRYGDKDQKNKRPEIKSFLKDKLQFIPVSRNEKEGLDVFRRDSIIPRDIKSELINLETNVGNSELENRRQRLLSILRTTKSISKYIRGYGSEIYIDLEGIGRIPIGEIGGGDQEFIQLIMKVRDPRFPIVLIEEPEAHLHADLQRQLYSIFEQFSRNNKQIIITTQSTVFVDKAHLQNTYLVKYDENRTTVKNLQNEKELREILLTLGIKPSDIFFAEKILFVEGESDRIFFDIVSLKLGIFLFKYGIATYPIGGVSKGRRHLGLWNEITKLIEIPKFFILDKGTEAEAEKIRKKDPSVKIHILKEGELEDYYPADLILEGVKAIADVKFEKEEEKEYKDKLSKAKKKIDIIFEILGKKGVLKEEDMKDKEKEFWWKVQLAEYIGKHIKKDQISGEIEEAIRNVAVALR
jgi:predicted ATP-dependent endonuclease of OLD family